MKRSDYEFFAALVRGEADAGNAIIEPHACVAAVVIAKPMLFVMSVEAAGMQRAAVNQRKSQAFELADRSASALRMLQVGVARFVGRAGIERLFLRASSDAGNHTPHAWNFKIEAALQLIDQVSVTFVNTQSVGAWVRRDEPQMPAFNPLIPGARWRDAQVRCLETALFVGAHSREARYFTDGSKRYG